MPRQAGIWRRESDGYWYTTHQYRKVRLAKSHAEAVAAFHRLKSGVPDTGDGLTVRDVCNYRLVFLRSNRSTRTYAEALRILGMFVAFMRPAMLAGDLRPHDIAAWVEGKPDWGPTYRHKVIATIQQAFSHAATDGLLAANPIARCRKPTPQTSVTLLTRDQVQQVIGACRDRALRDITEFLAETGCRPDEARRIESRHLDRRRLVLHAPGQVDQVAMQIVRNLGARLFLGEQHGHRPAKRFPIRSMRAELRDDVSRERPLAAVPGRERLVFHCDAHDAFP